MRIGKLKKPELSAESKKKIIKRILLCLLVSLPLIIALISFFISADVFKFSSENIYHITLTDEQGNVIAKEQDYPERADENGLVSIFYPMISQLSGEVSLPGSSKNLTVVKARVEHINSVDEYTFYFSFIEDSSYCVVPSGKAYLLDDEHVYRFLSSEYSRSLYSNATPIKLSTATGDIIEPSWVEWNYRTVADDYFAVTDAVTTDERRSYYMAERFELVFGVIPDVCSVRITQDGEEVFSGNYEELLTFSPRKGGVLGFELSAQWSAEKNKEFYGNIRYSFDVIMTDRSDFTVSGESFSHCSFCVIYCTNVADPSDIVVNIQPALKNSPSFVSCGNDAIAIVPFSEGDKLGKYNMTLSHSIATESFTLEVVAAEEGTDVESTAALNSYNKAFSNDAVSQLVNLKKEVAAASRTEWIFDGEFLDPAMRGATLGAAFSDVCLLGDKQYELMGNEYLTGEDSVVAVGSGRVVKVGYHAYLGNYVVVSHGAGLATWYAHLSNIDVSVGDFVVRGELVGKLGNTGLTLDGGESLLLLVTAGDTFTDPKYLCGKDLK